VSVEAAGRRIAPLFPTVAASYLGYAMMATLFVPMLMRPADGYLPPDAGLATRTTVIGLLLMLYPLGQFVGNPVLGALSDRFGRRPVVLASTAATIACYVGIASALTLRNLVLLAPFLLLCGLVEATIALTMSAIADVTTGDQRPRYLGYVYATTSVSYTVGPLAGGLIAEYLGYALPFWIVLVVLIAVLAWLYLRFAETLPSSGRRPAPLLRALSGLSQVVTDEALRRVYLGSFLTYVAAMGFWRVITIYLVDEWDLSVGPVTTCYAALSVAAGIGNLVLLPRLAGRVPMRRLTVVCLLGGAAAMAAVVVPSALEVPGALAAAVTLASVASLLLAVSLSAVGALLSSAAPPDRQGTVLGNNAALLVLGEVVGVSGGSFIAGIDPMLPLLVLAVLAAVAPAVLSRPRRHTAGAQSPRTGP
jgi:MFS transporter, DHA1 family, tetracycline resistance protein